MFDHFGFVFEEDLPSVVVLEMDFIIDFVQGFPLFEFRFSNWRVSLQKNDSDSDGCQDEEKQLRINLIHLG